MELSTELKLEILTKVKDDIINIPGSSIVIRVWSQCRNIGIPYKDNKWYLLIPELVPYFNNFLKLKPEDKDKFVFNW